jgi:Leucine-rich repeat (LRR) protein
MRELIYLKGNPWSDINWDEAEKPTIIVDGALLSLKALENKIIEGSYAYVVGANEKNIELICSRLNPILIRFYEMRVADLVVINGLKRLKHLAVKWNTKVMDITPVSELNNLHTLIIEDTPKIESIAPISKLRDLRYFEYSGGIWNKNSVESLQPIAQLQCLRSLTLHNVRVGDNSLKPIAECNNLEELKISNSFNTEEFAYLAANMPNTKCDMFQSYVKLDHSIGESDVMVVGSRKPFLNSQKDKAKLQKYEQNFAGLVEEYIN